MHRLLLSRSFESHAQAAGRERLANISRLLGNVTRLDRRYTCLLSACRDARLVLTPPGAAETKPPKRCRTSSSRCISASARACTLCAYAAQGRTHVRGRNNVWACKSRRIVSGRSEPAAPAACPARTLTQHIQKPQHRFPTVLPCPVLPLLSVSHVSP